MAKRLKKISRKADDLESLDAGSRHKLRIAVKKLRYANEFFHNATKLGDRKVAGALKELQDALGKLNDFVIHEDVSGCITRPDRTISAGSDKAFDLGVLVGKEDEKARHCLVVAREAAEALGRCRICVQTF